MFNKILIIGCGLIGSSIVRAVLDKRLAKKIYILEKSKKYISTIKKINKKLIIIKKLDKNINDMELVILSTPMSSYDKIIPYLNKFLSANSIITDIGSTRENVLNLKKKKLKKSLTWILSHPISGSEVSGPIHGKKNLFRNKWCIVVSDKNKVKLRKVIGFWKKMGSNIKLMNPREHDKIFAITSHLPHLIAYNLIKTAQDFQKKDKKNLITLEVFWGAFPQVKK